MQENEWEYNDMGIKTYYAYILLFPHKKSMSFFLHI